MNKGLKQAHTRYQQIVVVLIVSIPFKVKFMKWWSKRQQGKNQRGKWGDEE